MIETNDSVDEKSDRDAGPKSSSPSATPAPSPGGVQSRVFWALALVSVLVLAATYGLYARRAWFFQDDLLMMERFHESMRPDGATPIQDVGRYVSQNVYWNLGGHLFGESAWAYFAFNALMIAIAGVLISRIMRPLVGTIAAVAAGIAFAAMPQVIDGYQWIANSQHILAYVTCLLFVYLYLNAVRAGDLSWIRAIVLFGILAVSLLCNSFAVVLVALPVLTAILEPGWTRRPANWALAAGGGIASLILLGKIRAVHDETYSIGVSLNVLSQNVAFYFHRWAIFGIWVTVILVGFVWSARTRDLARCYLFLGSALFLLPFAFLRYQRYWHYPVMSMTFTLLAVWSLAVPAVDSLDRRAIVPLASLLMLGSTALGVRSFRPGLDRPLGVEQERQVAEMRQIVSETPSATTYCFSVPKPDNTSGVAAWDIPPFWWQTGFGASFRLLVNSEKLYQLTSDGAGCDVTMTVMDGSLHRAAK